mgnify:CR=1 FL=1
MGITILREEKKRFIKIFGNRINLDEVERLLKERYEGTDFACVGIDDCLRIFTDFRQPDAGEQVLDYLYQVTGIGARAVRVRCLDQIPKNESGKTFIKNWKPKQRTGHTQVKRAVLCGEFLTL